MYGTDDDCCHSTRDCHSSEAGSLVIPHRAAELEWEKENADSNHRSLREKKKED